MKGIKGITPVKGLPPVGTQRGAYVWRDIRGVCWTDSRGTRGGAEA